MKKINLDQIKAIMDELMLLNIPVKSYAGIQKLLNELPEVEQVLPTGTGQAPQIETPKKK